MEKKVNKKLNTALFMLFAVVLCTVITVLVFAALFMLMILVLKLTGDQSFVWALPIMFILSIVATFFIYNKILKIIFKKIDIDTYFDPIKLRWWK